MGVLILSLAVWYQLVVGYVKSALHIAKGAEIEDMQSLVEEPGCTNPKHTNTPQSIREWLLFSQYIVLDITRVSCEINVYWSGWKH